MIGTRYQASLDSSMKPPNANNNVTNKTNHDNDISHNNQSIPADNQHIGFDLQLLTDYNIRSSDLVIQTDPKLPIPNQIQFFSVDQTACIEDLKVSTSLAKQSFLNSSQTVLGTLMFTCSGRGPEPGFFPEEEYDACVYRQQFPHIPLFGCYVDGEIGPQLLGGVTRASSLFATSVTQASVQGYTAVFCLFAVPPRKSIPEMMSSLKPYLTNATMSSSSTLNHVAEATTKTSSLADSVLVDEESAIMRSILQYMKRK